MKVALIIMFEIFYPYNKQIDIENLYIETVSMQECEHVAQKYKDLYRNLNSRHYKGTKVHHECIYLYR